MANDTHTNDPAVEALEETSPSEIGRLREDVEARREEAGDDTSASNLGWWERHSLTVLAILLAGAGLALWGLGEGRTGALAELFREVGLAAFVAGFIGILVHLAAGAVLEKASQKGMLSIDRRIAALDDKTERLVGAVRDSSKGLLDSAVLLRNANEADVLNVYRKDRVLARVTEILRTAEEKDQQIAIMGVALEDYFDSQGPYHDFIKTLLAKEWVPERSAALGAFAGRLPEKRICALVSDPYSLDVATTAPLISDNPDDPSRGTVLARKIWDVMGQIVRQHGVGLRLCRAPIGMFAIITPDVALIRSYHNGFDAGHKTGFLPMYEIRQGSHAYRVVCRHFTTLWERPDLSVEPSALLEAKEEGTIVGAREAQLCNIYGVRKKADERIGYLLEAAQKVADAPPNWAIGIPSVVPNGDDPLDSYRVWLVGVSLRGFFDDTRPYTAALRELLEKAKEVKSQTPGGDEVSVWTPERPFVKALAVNPLGLDAMLRAMREKPGTNHRARSHYEQISNIIMESSKLYMEVCDSVRQVVEWRQEGLPIQLQLYVGSISAFLFSSPLPCKSQADPERRLLVEQYHYAKPVQNASGGQAPILEFAGGAELARQLEAHVRFLWAISTAQTAEVMKPLLDNKPFCAERWRELAGDRFAPPPPPP